MATVHATVSTLAMLADNCSVYLAPTLDVDSNGGSGTDVTQTFGYVLARLSGNTLQEYRKFFYRPNVAEVNDSTFSTLGKYNIITLSTGDRTDPLDNQTVALLPLPQDEIRNKIYAIRDADVDTGPRTSAPTVIVPNDLYDATGDQLLDTTASNCSDTDLKGAKGWLINLIDQEASPNVWVGEKSLARTVILDGWLYVTTYIPPTLATAQLTCSAGEGAGKLYAIPLLTGGFCSVSISIDLGGGIPPELSVITREVGTTGLIGTNECLDLPYCCQRGDTRTECCDRSVDPECGDSGPSRQKTFWFEE